MSPKKEVDDTLVIHEGSRDTEPALPTDRYFSLVVLEGKNQGTEFPINKWTVIIGRDASVSDFVLDDPGASRSHACLEFEKSGFIIEDLESTNGLSVNDRPTRRTSLKHGDRISIGKSVLQFLVEKSGRGPKVYQVEDI